MTEIDARCGTCDYWSRDHSRDRVHVYGQCEWPGPMPDALVSDALCMMEQNSGKHCKCWVRTIFRTSDSASCGMEKNHGT